MQQKTKAAVRREVFIYPEAFFFLGLALLLTALIKFSRVSRFLGEQGAKAPKAPDAAQLARAEKVRQTIETMSWRLPRETKCLIQAIAAQFMLKRRRINSTLYLGVALSKKKGMKAHAWVRCGGITLTGAKAMAHYTQVASFTNDFDQPG